MRILAVSDEVDERLYTPGLKAAFPRPDLVVGCGDLPYAYLEFLVSTFDVPLLYVPGNHDPAASRTDPRAQAEGCVNVDRRVVAVKGLIVAGLGGSMRYKPEGVNQYTQTQMGWRVAALAFALAWSQVRRRHSPDMILAHSPPRHIHDEEDLAHQGFSAFNFLIQWFKPRYFIHGHTMNYRQNLDMPHNTLGDTKIINISPYRVLEVENHA